MEQLYIKVILLNYLFIINTEGQVHTWKSIIKHIKNDGGKILIRARNYGHTLTLLRYERLEYKPFSPIRLRLFKPLDIIRHFVYGVKVKFTYQPNIVIGFGIDAAVIAKVCNAFSLVFTDSEPIGIQNKLLRCFCSTILTPSCFLNELGENQIRVPSYKELAYLHPDIFAPDDSVLAELGINKGDKYVLLRFNAFNAVHDIHRKGFTLEDKLGLIKDLKPFARILVSSESPLIEPINKYKLCTKVNRIHHVLFYATLLITDAGTMATEAAVLGIPALLLLPNYYEFGNFLELKNKYGLIHCFNDSKQLSLKAVELIKLDSSGLGYQSKRKYLLEDKVNMNQIFANVFSRFNYS